MCLYLYLYVYCKAPRALVIRVRLTRMDYYYYYYYYYYYTLEASALTVAPPGTTRDDARTRAVYTRTKRANRSQRAYFTPNDYFL